MPKILLKPGREKSVLGGHPWIFSGAIHVGGESVEPGTIVDVYSQSNNFLARGYYNPQSQIIIRVLTTDKNEKIDEEFFKKRITQAYNMRRSYIDGIKTNAFRLIHSEGDLLPGLIADYYAGYVVLQFHTLGMELLKPLIIKTLNDVIEPKGIYERSMVRVRQLEGLKSEPVGLLSGEMPPEDLVILENQLQYRVDIAHGQKTGFFLDQRENRENVQKFTDSKEVLNCFSYSGGFSVAAMAGGAKMVVTVDSSEEAIKLAKTNFKLNNFDVKKNEFLVEDCFQVLQRFAQEKRLFDCIVLDPPAFAKKQTDVPQALRGYRDINKQAMNILKPGGILVSASCSSYIDYELFFNTIRAAGSMAKRSVQILKTTMQPSDHPINAHFPEGRYLKCFFCMVQ